MINEEEEVGATDEEEERGCRGHLIRKADSTKARKHLSR
jgi:hypothetical protein